MKNNSNKAAIDFIFRQVAAMCGLRISYYLTAGLLAVSYIVLVLTGHASSSPLYILFSISLLPGLLQAMLFPASGKNEKRENVLPFPLFCKKFNYNRNRHKALNLSYLLLFVLLAAWRFSYAGNPETAELIAELPSAIAVISILSRILITAAYLLYFRCFPLKAIR